mgnify:CR=1 FL=1
MKRGIAVSANHNVDTIRTSLMPKAATLRGLICSSRTDNTCIPTSRALVTIRVVDQLVIVGASLIIINVFIRCTFAIKHDSMCTCNDTIARINCILHFVLT